MISFLGEVQCSSSVRSPRKKVVRLYRGVRQVQDPYRDTSDEYYDGGRTSWLKRCLNDGAPSLNIVGIIILSDEICFVVYLSLIHI